MEDLLIKIIEEAFGFPMMLQGSLLPEEPYPDNFFTYWNDSADGTGFYNNNESEILWQYSLSFYGRDPVKVNSILLEVKPILKAAGFIVTGAGYSVVSDEPTHTGRGITVRYRQRT